MPLTLYLNAGFLMPQFMTFPSCTPRPRSTTKLQMGFHGRLGTKALPHWAAFRSTLQLWPGGGTVYAV
jgi:hypothetical protein